MQSPKPSVRIVEQPAKIYRFRYKTEIHSVSQITGANSTKEMPTYPAIEITGCTGLVSIIISCVTADKPYKPHPNAVLDRAMIKKKNYKFKDYYVLNHTLRGQCTVLTFKNIGMIIATHKEVKETLKKREELGIDPFKTGFSHHEELQKKLTSVRLCFQVFIMKDEGEIALQPVVSDVITEKKLIPDLIIDHISHDSGPAYSPTLITIVCNKVHKEDITVIFFKEKDGIIIWEEYARVQNGYRGCVITCDTPLYPDTLDNKEVFIKLKRISDGKCSELVKFTYTNSKSAKKPLPEWCFPRPNKDSPEMMSSTCNQKVPPPTSITSYTTNQTLEVNNQVQNLHITKPYTSTVPLPIYENSRCNLNQTMRMNYTIAGQANPGPSWSDNTFLNNDPGPGNSSDMSTEIDCVVQAADSNKLETIKQTYLSEFESGACEKRSDFNNISDMISGTLSDIPSEELRAMEVSL